MSDLDFEYEIWKTTISPALGWVIKDHLAQLSTVKIKHNDPDVPAECVIWLDRPKPSDLIGVRVRQAKFYDAHGDITFRADGRSPFYASELEAIRQGWGRWYLYAWAEHDGALTAWVILDLDKMRKSKVLEDLPQKTRADGVTFATVPITTLFLGGCVVESALPGRDLPLLRTGGAKD